MRYSIITPTLRRASLLRACQSIDCQTNGDWEHLIGVNRPGPIDGLITEDPRRHVFNCGPHADDYGNNCRYDMWDRASGDYILYLDDDNYYADADVFSMLEIVTADWALFPLLYRGERTEPIIANADTNCIMHRREAARFPREGCLRDGDRLMVREQLSKFAMQAVDSRPLVIYEQEGWCLI